MPAACGNRRDMLRWLGAGACGWLGGGLAKAAELPLNNTGLEHYGLTVPDSRAAAEFYGRIFDPQLFQERDPPPRYYVKVGISYLAFGQNKEVAPYIDHFCALVQGYGPGELRKLLDAAGVRAGSGPGGMAEDPDGLRLQTLGVPGGLARTIIPATRISQDEALFQAIGTDHVVLRVSDLEKSAEHYRKLFGPELPRTKKPDRVWFAAARTRLALERAGPGEKASIHHVTFRVAGFDPRRGAEKLKRAGIEVVPADDKNAVRFRDPNGLVMELL